MELAEHFRVIWRHKWRVLLVSVIVAVAVFAYSRSQSDTFEARAELRIAPAQAATGEAASEDSTLFLARTYGNLATTRPVVEDAVKRAGLPISTSEGQDRVSADASTDVGFLTLTASGLSPEAARALCQGLADSLMAAVQGEQDRALERDSAPLQRELTVLQDQLNDVPASNASRTALQARYEALAITLTERQVRPADRVELVGTARAGEQPTSPTPRRDMALAFLAALIINAELAVALEALSDRFSKENLDAEVTRVTGLPVLAHIPKGSGLDVVEGFRILRTNLMFINSGEDLHSIGLVSLGPGAGKSFTATNLAISAADLDVPVLLIDADLRRPVIHERLDLARVPGLSDVLKGTVDLQKAIQRAPQHFRLGVLAAGRSVRDPAALLGGPEFSAIFASPGAAGLVIVDTPAEELFADAAAVASQCDAVIVVIDAATTRRRAVRGLLERLSQVNAKPLGVVINRTEGTSRRAYYYTKAARRPKERAELGKVV